MNDMTLRSNPAAEFAGQVAFVTGAARGIGLAVARMLASEGASVAMADVDAVQLEASAATLQADGLNVIALALDLRYGVAIEAAVARCEHELGPIDILASVAGVLHLGNLLDMDDCCLGQQLCCQQYGCLPPVVARWACACERAAAATSLRSARMPRARRVWAWGLMRRPRPRPRT